MEISSLSRGFTGTIAVVLALNTAMSTLCAAQVAEPLPDRPALPPMLYPTVLRGEDVIVTDTEGRQHTGQLLDAGADGVLLAPARDRQVFRWSEVAEVRHRKRDSPWNGLLIGVGAGMVGAIVARNALCSSPDPECEAIVNRVVVLPVVAGGVAMGALMDTLIRKEVVVYRGDARGRGRARLSVTPAVAPHGGGVHVSWTF